MLSMIILEATGVLVAFFYWYSSLLKREIEVVSLECYYQLCLKLVEYY